jgi:protein-tyrosine phosphatase
MQPVAKPHGSFSRETSYIRTVVQLTRNVEMGRIKAHVYFPTQVGESIVVPANQGLPLLPLRVTLLQTRSHEDAQCIQSTVAIGSIDSTVDLDAVRDDNSDKLFIFQHLMYTAWPDHGVPEDKDRDGLLAFLKLVDRVNRDTSLCNNPPTAAPISQIDPDPPMIVGCSAGVGRTGTFIALSSLLRENKFLPRVANPTPPSMISLSSLGALPIALSGDLVAEEVDFLREQRLRMVERPEQLLLIYETLISVSQNA